MAAKPNILLICADQWRADCISALGHPHVRTPNLDGLAADGVLFENHFGQTTPCGPSRTSLLTGLYLMNHRSGTVPHSTRATPISRLRRARRAMIRLSSATLTPHPTRAASTTTIRL